MSPFTTSASLATINRHFHEEEEEPLNFLWLNGFIGEMILRSFAHLAPNMPLSRKNGVLAF